MKQYHIACAEGQVGGYVLLPGDPGRCEAIASLLDNAAFVARNREFTTYTGSLLGEPVSVTSTGIGGPSTAIAVEELSALGAHTFIRVGTCGGMQPDVRGGDLVVATGAIRMEGTSREYLPIAFPAAPDFSVLRALADAAAQSGAPFHTGVVQSKDSFYGQHDPGRMPVGGRLEADWRAWQMGGALASEMEAAALFTVCAALGRRAGAVFMVVGNQALDERSMCHADEYDKAPMLKAAVAAVRQLIWEGREK